MHNIEYRTYAENVNRDWVQKELDHYVAVADYQEDCTGLGKAIRWLDGIAICGDRQMAETVIEQNDRGWYDCLAVKYLEPVRSFNDKKLEQLQQKRRDALDAYHKKDAVWVRGLKAEYVGCRKCGSKMKREYIRTNRCPLCGSDLRPESTLKAVEVAKTKADKAVGACEAYVNTKAKKEVKWLVKIEYHT